MEILVIVLFVVAFVSIASLAGGNSTGKWF